MWDKNSEAIAQWLPGDTTGVVNCLEGHPNFPIIATSGLDHDIKMWIPTSPTNVSNFNLIALCFNILNLF